MSTKRSKKATDEVKIFMSAKSDIIFKLLFGNELNKDLLVKFLMAVLKLPLDEYTDIQISDPQSKRKYKGDKLAILDVKVKTSTNKIINIEIQVTVTPEMRERIVFYNAKMITEQLKSGDDYKTIKRTINIIITGERFIHEHEMYHDTFTIYSSKTKTEFTDVVEIHTLELPKLPQTSDGTDLWDWLKFINSDSEEELKVLAQKSPQMKDPVDKLLELNQDSHAREIFEAHEKQRRDNASKERKARLEGRLEGIQEAAFYVAKNLLKMNMPVEDVATATGLSVEEIEGL